MELSNYIRSLPQDGRAEFAERCGISLGYLKQIACGYRVASAEVSVLIERLSEGIVTRKDLRPDDWQNIWPELALVRLAQAPDGFTP